MRISRALHALAAQRGPLPPFSVLLLANNCRDETAEVGRRTRPAGLDLHVHEVTLALPQANVGGARRLALDLAADLAGEQGIIVSTDADTLTHPDWLAGLLAPLRCSAASAGRLMLDPGERARLSAPIRHTHLLDCAYRWAATQLTARLDPDPHDPWPRHWQHFGASLALHVWAYRAVGGLPEVPCLEDVALVQALRHADLPLRHTLQARAYTSARLSGRVPVGLSTQLQEWQNGPECWTVPGAAEVAALARAEAALRAVYGHAGTRHTGTEQSGIRQSGPMLARIGHHWMLPEQALRDALEAPRLGLALHHAHRAREQGGLWRERYPAEPVTQALRALRQALAEVSPGETVTGLRSRPMPAPQTQPQASGTPGRDIGSSEGTASGEAGLLCQSPLPESRSHEGSTQTSSR
ncbi:glycosyl transferase family 2 [Deinococcus koreensis]|uniref:Glycosyl transferase family 2 n=2 Tax=Deinococcus koreensis TaxID=2054903 RepID=A0A2K3USV4_9DEIO|nr:glycosyl transferase family 2 [Deinococcus koreensis]